MKLFPIESEVKAAVETYINWKASKNAPSLEVKNAAWVILGHCLTLGGVSEIDIPWDSNEPHCSCIRIGSSEDPKFTSDGVCEKCSKKHVSVIVKQIQHDENGIKLSSIPWAALCRHIHRELAVLMH